LATFTAFARTFLDDVDAAAVQTTLGLVPGTNVQAYDAELAAITLRSVHPQSKPYRPINSRSDFQSVWKRENLRGTFVGIRSPRWAHGITVPGYHWHFLAADRRSGGHVLDCHLRGGTILYDVCGSWLVKLDESADFNSVNLSTDLGDELDRIERLRGGPADGK
jgi:acetolactate decarboxylase